MFYVCATSSPRENALRVRLGRRGKEPKKNKSNKGAKLALRGRELERQRHASSCAEQTPKRNANTELVGKSKKKVGYGEASGEAELGSLAGSSEEA